MTIKIQLFSRNISCFSRCQMALVHFMGCLWFLGSLWTGIFLWNCAAGANPLDVQQNDTRQFGRAVGGINFDEGSRLSTSLKGTLDSLIPQGQL